MVELGRRSLNYNEARARHNPIYFKVSCLTMEEGDVRGARAGPAQMVENMRTNPKGLLTASVRLRGHFMYMSDFNRAVSRNHPGENSGFGMSRLLDGRDPGISRDPGKLKRIRVPAKYCLMRHINPGINQV